MVLLWRPNARYLSKGKTLVCFCLLTNDLGYKDYVFNVFVCLERGVMYHKSTSIRPLTNVVYLRDIYLSSERKLEA